jgi:DNA-directed RNA polymerase subunit RPC12/RpoP
MNDYINTQNETVVNRQTQTTVPNADYEELPEGLPFYYSIDMKWAILMIIFGIIIGFVQIAATGFFLFLPFLRKEYRCIRCKSKYTKIFKPEKCPLCGGILVSENEYIKNQYEFEKINNTTS